VTHSQEPALQAYSGGSSEDQTPTQLFQANREEPLETRSSPYASPPSVEVAAPSNPLRQSRPSIVPPAYAHYPKIQSVPPPPVVPRSRLPIFGAVAALLLVVAYFVMRPSTGSLVITVSGPGGRMVDGVEVFVDGEKKCSSSPCKIDGIGAGAHFIRASAVGYQSTADQAVSVLAGEHSTHNLSLAKASATGFKVSALGSGLMLYVDGREVGPLPQTLTDLSPGEHTIRIGGNPRYRELEQKVVVEPDTVQQIGPLQLDVLKGLATFKAGPGADGAKVLVDGRLVPALPTTVEVPFGKTPELVARKPGYVTYRRTVSFEDGVAEKTFEITMVEGSSGEDGAAAAPPSAGKGGRSPVRPPQGSAPPSASGQATLNMNSIPVSNVILNGRPLGQTPKVGVQVPPGPVTVVFVHPEMGRKVQSGTVTAGATRTFMARFP
jgi:hypothetical protein